MATKCECWGWVRDDPRRAAENMAADEVLLAAVEEVGHPILRFYCWAVPAASFGYFQRFEEVAAWTALRPLVRRPTGGGLVPHDGDWTYSLVFPRSHPWASLRAAESYRKLHGWLQASMAQAGVLCHLAVDRNRPEAGRCFIGAEESDLLFAGRKVAGAAQRRSRSGLLIQGSVQPQSGWVGRDVWEKAFRRIASEQAVEWTPFSWTQSLENQIRELALAKYASDAYNLRR